MYTVYEYDGEIITTKSFATKGEAVAHMNSEYNSAISRSFVEYESYLESTVVSREITGDYARLETDNGVFLWSVVKESKNLTKDDGALGEVVYNSVMNTETYDMLGCNIKNVLLNTKSEAEYASAIRMLEAVSNIKIERSIYANGWSQIF